MSDRQSRSVDLPGCTSILIDLPHLACWALKAFEEYSTVPDIAPSSICWIATLSDPPLKLQYCSADTFRGVMPLLQTVCWWAIQLLQTFVQVLTVLASVLGLAMLDLRITHRCILSLL